MRLRLLLLLLILGMVTLAPVWAQDPGPGGVVSSKAAILGNMPTFSFGDMTTIGPDGTFYSARPRLRPRTDTTTPTILPQQTIVRAIGVHDPRDPRCQITIDGTAAGLEAGERNVYVVGVTLPTMVMGNTNTGSAAPMPISSAARLVLLNAATGAVVRVVNLAGGTVRSMDLKRVQNTDYIYVVTLSPVTILIFPPPPPAPILEIFDADGTRIKQVTLSPE